MTQIDYTLRRGEDEIALIIDYNIERAEPDVGIMGDYAMQDGVSIHENGKWVPFDLTEKETADLDDWLQNNVDLDDSWEPDYDD